MVVRAVIQALSPAAGGAQGLSSSPQYPGPENDMIDDITLPLRPLAQKEAYF